MSQTVDHRVVEMRFDNKEFEAGAKQTMGTLGKLKEALKLPDSSKAFEELDKATKGIRLDGIAAGVDALNKRFSFLGRTVAKIADDIRDVLMNKVHSAVSFVTDSIVSGGIKRAMNIENAHFQLQALLKDEVQVQAVMADAMESVDGTAYAYDEAAKAASQFAASGLKSGEQMQQALRGITGVAAMTNSEYEGISRIFTTVAGQGRLMGDQLLQLSSRGMNAASTIANYFQEVQGQADATEASVRKMVSEGKISFEDFANAMSWAFGDSAKRANETFNGALSNMKSALARIGAGFISPLVEQNGELVKLFNALRIKINEVKSELVFDEQRSAIAGLAEATGITNDALKKMFETIKARGRVSGEDLRTLADNGVHASKAMMNYINGVNDGSIRATYAISSTVKEFTNGTDITIRDVRRLVEEGKIDLSIFTAAMESEFGKEKTLSKQFTDWFLDQIHRISDAVNSLDITKPMEIFYHWVEIAKNLAKGAFTFITPLGEAFRDVFLVFSADDIINLSIAVEKLTSKMKLSERGSKNLRDAFKGVFSVVKLGADVFLSLLNAILPIGSPVAALGEGFLSLTGIMGRGLSSFTDTIRSSELLNGALSTLSSGLQKGSSTLTYAIQNVQVFSSTIANLSGTKKLTESMTNAFRRFSKFSAPYVDHVTKAIGGFIESTFHLKGINLDSILDAISRAFEKLASVIDRFSLDEPIEAIEDLKKKLRELYDLMMTNEGFATFVRNAQQYGRDLKNAFTLEEIQKRLRILIGVLKTDLPKAFSFENILKRMELTMSIFEKFFQWITTNLRPAFEEFEISSALAAAGGAGIIVAMLKVSDAISKSLASLSKLGSGITGVLGGVKGALLAYQKELKADALMKVAAGIAMLAAALVLLSFADPRRLITAAISFGILAGFLMSGINQFLEALNKGKELNTAATIVSKGLSSAMKKFGRALEIRAIGAAVNSFAKSVAIIAVSIIALGVMYKKDKEALLAGGELVAIIATVMVAIMGSMTLMGQVFGAGMKSFAAAALGILALTASLTMCINALNKLFKMEFPEDWEFKLKVLEQLLERLGYLAVVIGIASRIGGSGKRISAAPILALTAMLAVTVLSLNALFKMEFPTNWEDRVAILYGIFIAFGSLMIAIGAASRLAGGAIKASGTILSMCLFLAVAVAALMVLAIMPGEKLLKGAIALGLILTTLGIALFGAGKITDKNATNTVLMMALTVGAITTALAVLGGIPFAKILKATVALGSILLLLSKNLEEAGKIKDKNSWLTVLAMTAAVGTIAYSLYQLAEQPWPSLLAGAAGLSAVLLSLAETFKIISNNNPDVKQIGKFLLAMTSLIPIGIALYELSTQPWEGLLAAAVALSGTLLAFGLTFSIIASANPDLKAIGTFIVASGMVGVIAYSLYQLAEQPWENVLAAAESISMVLLAVSAAMGVAALIGSVAPAAIVGAGLILAFIVSFAGVLAALGAMFHSEGAQALLSGGVDVLAKIGQAIGEFVGSIVAGTWTKISGALPEIGENLSQFMVNLTPFIVGSKMIDGESLTNVGYLAAIIVALTAGEIVNGIAKLFGLSLEDVGLELSKFMVSITPFVLGSRMLSEESMKACQYLASMILTLTASEIMAGIANWLGIGGSLADFGEQLTEFGPSISEFADQVKDVKPEAVQGAAAAGKIMAELANNLPGQDGLVQKIFGEKSLKDFADELTKFGPAITEFADQVKDVKPEAVQGAAAAGEIMAGLASKLPDQDGFAQKIFGTRSLAEFGEELEDFGPSIVGFAEEVADVDASSVQGAANVGEIMAELANNLPESDSLYNKIFGGGQITLSQFGEELVKFGTSMTNFSSSITSVNTVKIMSTISTFKQLADLPTYLEGKNVKALTVFVTELEKVSLTAVEKFLDAFSNSKSDVGKAISTFVHNISNEMQTRFNMLEVVMEQRGKQIVTGVNRGINNNTAMLYQTVATMASSIDNTLRQVLAIRSPSKKGEESGNYYGEGVKNGITNATKYVRKAAADMGMQTTEGLASSLTSGGSLVKNALDSSLLNEQNYWRDYVDTGASGVEESDKLNKKKLSNDQSALGSSKKIKEEGVNAEKNYWTALLAVKQAGADAEKYKSMTIQEFQKEILDETVKILEEYQEKMESARDSIMNTFGLFTEVSFDDALSKEALQNNLADQIRAYQNYDKVLGELNERLEGTALGEHLRTLGVESLEQLRVINYMTDEELTRYSDMYDQKLSAATKAAETQLTTLQSTTEEKLAGLYGIMKEQVNLMDFSAAFNGTFASIDTYVTQIVTGLSAAGESIRAEGEQLGTEFVSGFWMKLLEDENSFGNLDGTFAKLSSDNAEGAKNAGKEVGNCITAGIGEGLLEDDGSLPGNAETILNNISEALKAAGEIHSPSELTKREVGVPLVQGISEGMKEETASLGEASQAVVENIKTSLTGSDVMASMKTIGQEMMAAFVSSFGEVEQSASTIGGNVVDNYINPFITKKDEKVETVRLFVEEILKILKEKEKQYLEEGNKSATQYLTGIKNNLSAANSAGHSLADSALQAIVALLGKFLEAGRNAGRGLVDGIRENLNEATRAGREIARAAYEAAMRELDEESPSKKMRKVGSYGGEGFVLGILDWISRSKSAGEGLGDSLLTGANRSIQSISDSIANEIDVDPTITPLLDLSEVRRSANEINDLFNQAIRITDIKAQEAAISVRTSRAIQQPISDQNGESDSKTKEGTTTFNFIQNNTSPKALSRIDIYRQTKAQFEQFKEEMREI